ncbi:hypothetical protein [Methylobacterium trifolii]|uniref:Secreted protein n=1 Tax=Methylobacterium trifolii TaxID=1003092 RepID=A0ABQ4U443_9HYPH|nr:hypothetical protein [Methylobacterium trifolii]GJE62219.1 hypothetical protein MPOCJGCO_4350 [Methylobacterium trifolii]
MRRSLLAAGAVLTLLGVSNVQAQTTVIEREGPDRVVVDRPAAESKSVTVREHGDGCVSKTVKKENADGDRTTVHKETCD